LTRHLPVSRNFGKGVSFCQTLKIQNSKNLFKKKSTKRRVVFIQRKCDYKEETQQREKAPKVVLAGHKEEGKK